MPGDLEESLIYNAITHEDFVMPPKRKLSQDIDRRLSKMDRNGSTRIRAKRKIAEIRSTISDDDIQDAKAELLGLQDSL